MATGSSRTRLTIPKGPARQCELLPLAQMLSDRIVSATCHFVERTGETISCRAGCGACCRNLVAISQVESRNIAKLVDELPGTRRSEIRKRFAAARVELEMAGLLSSLKRTEQLSVTEYKRLSELYFDLKIACPFLENESCSIYQDRPVTCREYLVTSPAENCERPGQAEIRRVKVPLPVFNAVARWLVPESEAGLERWVPLILAPEWAASHPSEPSVLPGLELLRELARHLTPSDAPS